MTKLKITKKQYTTILLREQESRINDNREVISENTDETTKLLSEGWREVVLGVALMLGVRLTGQNRDIAQKAVKNATIMNQIKATLEHPKKIDDLVDAMEEKGMKDPSSVLAKHAERIMNKFNSFATKDNLNHRIDVKVVNNLQALNGMVQATNLENTNETIETTPETPITVQDTLDIEINSDNLFKDEGFTLTTKGEDVLQIAIQEIKKQGGKLLGVEIIVSTDAETMIKFKSESDQTGNIKLADLRMKSIANSISTLESGVSIKHREIPNNGSTIVSNLHFDAAINDKAKLINLKNKTKEYRYVKLKLTMVFESNNGNQKPGPTKIINTYRSEMIKVINNAGKIRDIETKAHFKFKKFKCTRKKSEKEVSDECITL